LYDVKGKTKTGVFENRVLWKIYGRKRDEIKKDW
jgi:hypothetical protein